MTQIIKQSATLRNGPVNLSWIFSDQLDEVQAPPVPAETPRLFTVLIPDGASIEVTDDLHELGWINTTLELLVGTNATLTYTLKATQGIEHVLNGSQLVVDATVLNRTINVRLVGQGARATIRCLCFGFGKKTFKFKTLQDHQAPDATSSLVIKTVLDDQSQLICHNLIKVQKNAQRTDAEQENKNILLARGARAVSIPMLEIEADDVRCQHGAAVSRLDNEHLFYLQSRGLDVQQTRQMLIESFLS
ncbi:SufD family Fe-S cluster assembly protein [Candidatus Babeliales bacterium]|nr:SufD family Fe-S cluster assembly protein [Candidatus Babeliales bacterium]